MRSPFVPGVGGVLSADIAVPEHEQEVGFYSKILTTGSDPLWRDDLMNNRGMPVIGLGARVPEYESLPLQWMPHFQVADVGASTSRAVELGGGELMHGRDDAGQSQWAVLSDPAGAAFGLIPAVDGASVPAEQLVGVGGISGLMLVASDVASACEFYAAVIGWTVGADGAGGGIEMNRADGGTSAVVHAADEYEGVPSVWILSLPVGDLAASTEHVRDGGGEVIYGSAAAGQVVVRDPVGVVIALQSAE